jgi:hypothetical protein
LIKGSSASKKDGLFSVLEGNGDGVIMVTDPPYTAVKRTSTTKRHAGRLERRPIAYGALSPSLRKAIAQAVAVVEWSAIWDRFEGMFQWKREIEKWGGVWLGTATVLQARGAPRLDGSGPGIRTLAIAMARRKGRARWKGRTWAEYIEFRSSTPRPIVGTRSIETAQDVVRDLMASCADGCGLMLDPCAGTGMVMQAGRLEGIEAIGWEIDPETHAYAQELLEGKGDESEAQPCLW